MENQDSLLRLFSDLEGLKKSLAGSVNYTKLRFTYEDILGFMDDKIIHVFMKYPDKPYNEVKALCITSLYNVKYRLYRKYGKEVNVEEFDAPFIETKERPQLSHLVLTVTKLISESQVTLAEIILNPPEYILSKLTSFDKRIPSRLILEYLDYPINKSNIKRLNTFRRNLINVVREKVNPETFELINIQA